MTNRCLSRRTVRGSPPGGFCRYTPLTAGLNSRAVMRAVEQALAICDPPAEILPPELREKYGILPAETAYRAIHQPQTMEEAAQAKKRMIFEEFFVFSAGLSLMRASRAEKQVIPYTQLDLTEFYQLCPLILPGPKSGPSKIFWRISGRGVP